MSEIRLQIRRLVGMEPVSAVCRFIEWRARKLAGFSSEMKAELKEQQPALKRYHSKMLQYKTNRVVEVNPYNTTVKCSRCGNKVPKTLAVRIHECDRCGTVLDRDHNSSMVIEDRGRALLGLPMRHREVTPVDDRESVAEAGTSSRSFRDG